MIAECNAAFLGGAALVIAFSSKPSVSSDIEKALHVDTAQPAEHPRCFTRDAIVENPTLGTENSVQAAQAERSTHRCFYALCGDAVR
jgi:hypothetical protein